MGAEEVLERVAEAAAVAAGARLAELLTKLLSGTATKDDVGHGLAGAAIDVGIAVADLPRYVTDEGAARIEEADALMREAVYGRSGGSGG